MPIQTTYTDARARLAGLCDEAAKNREVVIIRRRGSEDVALIAADELESLQEAAHLLRSPENAGRLALFPGDPTDRLLVATALAHKPPSCPPRKESLDRKE